MLDLQTTQAIPLEVDEHGTIRVTGSRVTVESIINQFQSGATAEQIQEDFPTVPLSHVYSTIAFYLQHKQEFSEYLERQLQASANVRLDVEPSQSTAEIRERLQRKRAEQSK
jgi:uncharacterized protein (DUF433 family)